MRNIALPAFISAFVESPRLRNRAFALALQCGRPVHDCFYAACAEAASAPLVSADEAFLQALQDRGHRAARRAARARARARRPRDAMDYAELQVTTNYSFLRSGSHPERAGRAGDRARPHRHRHHRPQHAGRRGAGLCGVARMTKTRAIPEQDQAAGRRPPRDARRLFAARLSDRSRRLQAPVAPADRRQPARRKGPVRSHLRRSCGLRRRHPRHRPAAAPARRSGLPRAPARACPPVRRPLLSRRHHAVPRRRCAPPRPARQSRRRDEAWASSPPTTCTITCPSAGRCRTWSRPSGSAAPSTSWASAASPAPSVISRSRRRWRACSAAIRAPSQRTQEIVEALQLLARRPHLPVSRRLRRRRDADGQARPADLGGRGVALSREASRTRWPIRSGTNSSSSRTRRSRPTS